MIEIDYKQAELAIKALQTYEAKQTVAKQKKDLLSDEKQTIIWMVITMKTVPDSSNTNRKPHRIPLKHSIIAPDAEICLITKDPQRTYKDLLAQKNVKRISKVIGYSKLRDKFKPYEAKRQLCASYDLFLADDRVLPLLPKTLGKTFFERKKLPIPVKLTINNLKNEIERVIHSTYVYFNTGTCTALKIGTSGLSATHIRENIETALPAVLEKIPKKWQNVQSIHLKTATSFSLPIFNSLPDIVQIKEEVKENDA